MIALNSRESLDEIAMVQAYAENLQVTYDVGIESPATTYQAAVANFPGPNPFPLAIIVGRDGIIRYIGKEVDIDAMTSVIEQALAE